MGGAAPSPLGLGHCPLRSPVDTTLSLAASRAGLLFSGRRPSSVEPDRLVRCPTRPRSTSTSGERPGGRPSADPRTPTTWPGSSGTADRGRWPTSGAVRDGAWRSCPRPGSPSTPPRPCWPSYRATRRTPSGSRPGSSACPVATGSLGGAVANRVLLHLARHDVPLALADLHRALAVEGPAFIRVMGHPDGIDVRAEGPFAGRLFSAWAPGHLETVCEGAGLPGRALRAWPLRAGLEHLGPPAPGAPGRHPGRHGGPRACASWSAV